MKIVLSIVLLVLVTSIITTPVFADSKMDSFVNLVTQARAQVKIQIDKTSSNEIKSMYSQGDQETEELIAAVKKGDAAEAKKHFLAAMKIFRHITQVLSEQLEPDTPVIAFKTNPKITQTPEFDYANALKRFEGNIKTLKTISAKNNFDVDFGKIDKLLETAKSHLTSGDMELLEKAFVELKAAGIELQNTIKNMAAERSNTRAIAFANKYIAKIDTILAQTEELGLSEDDITKLNNAKEELTSGGDASQIILKIKKVYQVNIDVIEPKNQRLLIEVLKLENRLSLLEPKIDDNMAAEFEEAKSIISSLRNSTSDNPVKSFKTLTALVNDIEKYFSEDTDDKIESEEKQSETKKDQKPKTAIKKQA